MLTNERPPLTIAEAARLIEAGKLSPVELVQDCLGRIDALDGTYHAFITVLHDAAMSAARKAQAEIEAGDYRGPLHGIPIGLKDIYQTVGVTTTAHSRVAADHVPEEDATTTALLAASGAVNLGKLATWEFAIGGPSFDLPWPPAGNPWNPEHDPGGSSSGTGTAVAAGMVLGGMGSDTGGSIRFPAALCGIAGIKPSYGRVSRTGVMPLSFSLDHAGPMAWTSEDCALMLQAIAGHDPRDPASADVPVPDYRAALDGRMTGLRVGMLRQFYEVDAPAEPEVACAVEDSVAVFRDLGAEIVEVPPLSPMADYLAAAFLISRTEAFSIHEDGLRRTPELYGDYARARMCVGALVSGADYMQALRRRRELCVELAEVMREIDLLILPTTPTTAPKLGGYGRHFNFDRPLYTGPFNLTGSPAMSVCCGFGDGQLPIGMQIVGRPFAEATVLRAGDAYERATRWRQTRPEVAALVAA